MLCSYTNLLKLNWPKSLIELKIFIAHLSTVNLNWYLRFPQGAGIVVQQFKLLLGILSSLGLSFVSSFDRVHVIGDNR